MNRNVQRELHIADLERQLSESRNSKVKLEQVLRKIADMCAFTLLENAEDEDESRELLLERMAQAARIAVLTGQLSEAQAEVARLKARWKYVHDEPEAMRHLLQLLMTGKGDHAALDRMVDRIIGQLAAARAERATEEPKG